MTAPHIVDPHGMLSEALIEASPDLDLRPRPRRGPPGDL